MLRASSHFSRTYAEARGKFIDAAQRSGALLGCETHPSARGVDGEALSMDTALLGDEAVPALLIVTSGTHGVEGYGGSGCQVVLLNDRALIGRLQQAGVALLLVHAVNPHGFSHRRRVNEDNIDLNRNFLRFDDPLPHNSSYGELHDLLVPAVWPPTAHDRAALAAAKERLGERAFRRAVTAGQSERADGLFYSGTAPS